MTCTSCPLHQSCSHPCVAMRGMGQPPPSELFPERGKDQALLVIGEAPGVLEDRKGVCWIGPTGRLLHALLAKSKLPEIADVYLANALRCRLLQDQEASRSQIAACRPHLLADIAALKARYPRVSLLALGTAAALSVSLNKLKITQAISRAQGRPTLEGLQTFFSYHPSILLPGRQPSLIRAVGSHLNFVHSVLSGSLTLADPTTLPPRSLPLPSPAMAPDVVALDIETYGILDGREQTVFHPKRSLYVDRIHRPHQIVTVSLAWHEGSAVRSTVFVWSDPHDRRVLYQWLVALRDAGSLIVGQNLPFDLSYLRYNNRDIASVLRPPLRLDDISLLNYLDYELRPEKSLKSLAELFGQGDYKSLGVNARDSLLRAKSEMDPELWRYNATDAEATLRLRSFLLEGIRKRYGPSSPKLSRVCAEHRNNILWTILDLRETGLCLSLPSLRQAAVQAKQELSDLLREASALGLLLSGEGSDASRRSVIESLVASWMQERGSLTPPNDLHYTPKQKKLSYDDHNIRILEDEGVVDPRLAMLRRFSDLSKLINSYLSPLATDKRRGICSQWRVGAAGCAYPDWFPVPFLMERGASKGDTAGTIQGRFSAKNPPVQTFPPSLKACFCSRFEGGHVLSMDLSQIELRIAALCSGDPIMLDAYRTGQDLHTITTLKCIPGAIENSPEWDTQRKAGKTLNFLVLYRGGASKFRATLYDKAGISWPLNRCESMLSAYWSDHPVLRAWQDSLISLAKQQGYLELLTGWGRTFSGGPSAVDATYINEICNLPVQCYASQLFQSGHYALLESLRARGLRSLIFLQEHDAIYLDVYPGERLLVESLIRDAFTPPPLAHLLFDHYGRAIPITYELKEPAP